MSSPSDDQLAREPERRMQPSTQEIPVVQPPGATAAGHSPQHGAAPLPPHPGALTPAPIAMDEPQPTGPVDFVPGLPGTPPVPPPAATPPLPPVQPADGRAGAVWPDTLETEELSGKPERSRRIPAPQDRAAVFSLGLAVLALVLLELGLTLHFGTRSYWSAVPLWSAFATLCAALGVVALAAGNRAGLRSNAVWRLGVAGVVGLAVFWLLVVLSVVATDRGFLLTAALGALGAALWVGPGRKA